MRQPHATLTPQTEYFGTDAAVSVGFCQSGKKMLVFAVLIDKSGLTASNEVAVVVHRPAHQLPLFVITFKPNQEAMAAAMGGIMAAAVAAAAGGAGFNAPPAFVPFSGAGNVLSAPARHVLRRAAPSRLGAPLRCSACAVALASAELALCRTGGADRVDTFHLRCAAAAQWAPDVPLQPLLRDYAARAEGGGADATPLTDRELAVVYEELGSDERRAKRQARR